MDLGVWGEEVVVMVKVGVVGDDEVNIQRCVYTKMCIHKDVCGGNMKEGRWGGAQRSRRGS